MLKFDLYSAAKEHVEINNIKTPSMELNHFVSGDENIISLEKNKIMDIDIEIKASLWSIFIYNR